MDQTKLNNLRRVEPMKRMQASAAEIVNFIEWLADQPCQGNGSGKLCRVNSPDDPTWCCHACRAYLLRYGTDPTKWASTG